MMRKVGCFLLVIMAFLSLAQAGGIISASVANNMPASPVVVSEIKSEPVVPASPAVTQEVAKPIPAIEPAPVTPVPAVEPAPPTVVAPALVQPEKPAEVKSESSETPTLEAEKIELEKTIQEIAVEPKVFAPVPDINEKTQPSKQLQEESKKIAQKPIAVDDKTFAQEEKNAEPTITKGIPSTLDTTRVDAGGNWVIKRAFWEQAERTYEKIMQANSAIYENQIKFVKARNEADDLSDVSFRKLGFEQGQLSNVLERILEEVKNQREKQGLNEEERLFLQKLKEKQQELEQLKLNLQAIDELDNVLDQTMLNLNNQVVSCRSYEKQAWDHFKAIGHELNDKKARVLFYEMEGFWKTVEKNQKYMNGQLWTYFDETVRSIKQKFDELASHMSTMQQKGLDFAKELERFAQADREKEKKILDAEHQKLDQERAELEKQKIAAPVTVPTVWGHVKGAMIGAWDYTLRLFNSAASWVKHLFGIK